MTAQRILWIGGAVILAAAAWYFWPKSAQTTPRRAQTGSGPTLSTVDSAPAGIPAKIEALKNLSASPGDKLDALRKMKKAADPTPKYFKWGRSIILAIPKPK